MKKERIFGYWVRGLKSLPRSSFLLGVILKATYNCIMKIIQLSQRGGSTQKFARS